MNHDMEFCIDILPKVSRTFTLSIEMLPESLRASVRVAYLLCRIVDTIEDEEDIRVEDRVSLFEHFDTLMKDDEADPEPLEAMSERTALALGKADATLCQRAGAVFRAFRGLVERQKDAIRPHVLEMSSGMQRFSARKDREGELRLHDMAELERYCYFVAGTVGNLLTDLFVLDIGPHQLKRAQREEIERSKISFGLGLQMVNIVKDVTTDLERGDVFLPVSLALREGIALDEMLDNREAGLKVIRAVCQRARVHLEKAEAYALSWPEEEAEGIRLFCAVPLTMALASLREVEEGDDTLRAGRTPKISRRSVFSILSEAKMGAGSNEKLKTLFAKYR